MLLQAARSAEFVVAIKEHQAQRAFSVAFFLLSFIRNGLSGQWSCGFRSVGHDSPTWEKNRTRYCRERRKGQLSLFVIFLFSSIVFVFFAFASKYCLSMKSVKNHVSHSQPIRQKRPKPIASFFRAFLPAGVSFLFVVIGSYG